MLGWRFIQVEAISRWWVELSGGVRGDRCIEVVIVGELRGVFFGNSVYYILFSCVFYLSLLSSNIFPLRYFQITERVIKRVGCAAVWQRSVFLEVVYIIYLFLVSFTYHFYFFLFFRGHIYKLQKELLRGCAVWPE